MVLEKFDPEAVLAAIQTYSVTITQLVPTMFVRLLQLPQEVRDSYDTSSLRIVVHAAAPCPPDVKTAMIDWWGPILVEYYAGSESIGGTVIGSQDWLRRPGSVGRARR